MPRFETLDDVREERRHLDGLLEWARRSTLGDSSPEWDEFDNAYFNALHDLVLSIGDGTIRRASNASGGTYERACRIMIGVEPVDFPEQEAAAYEEANRDLSSRG